MIKVITCDVDGILTNLYQYQERMVENHFTRKGEPVPKKKNPDAYDIADIYEISKNRRNIIWLEGYKQYRLYAEARKNAFEILNYWQDQGKKIVLVTSPAFGTYPIIGSKVKNWCREWQDSYNFVANDIIWCPEKNSGQAKAKACLDLNSDLMIEDKIDNIDPILDICDTIALESPYNQYYQPDNKLFDFYMNNDWDEIKDTVDLIEKKVRKLR